MAQNIYDTASFFKAYSTLPRSAQGLSAAPEWPTLRSLVGAVNNKRVLDLGSGFGYFVQWAQAEGATRVLGIDLSENMLRKARELIGKDGERKGSVSFERADLDKVILERESFDVVFSSLTIHYLEDLGRVFKQVFGCLVDEGRFVFSCEHPIFTAPRDPGFREVSVQAEGEGQSRKAGEAKKEVIWPLNAYFHEGARTTDWLAKGVRKQHRTLSSIFTALLEAGFEIRDVREWVPSQQDLKEHPEWKGELDRPMFLLVSAGKK